MCAIRWNNARHTRWRYRLPRLYRLGNRYVQQVILTGAAGDNCVLFTAADAYMCNFEVAVPAGCTVSIDPHANRSALEHMRETLKADTALSKTIIEKLAA